MKDFSGFDDRFLIDNQFVDSLDSAMRKTAEGFPLQQSLASAFTSLHDSQMMKCQEVAKQFVRADISSIASLNSSMRWIDQIASTTSLASQMNTLGVLEQQLLSMSRPFTEAISQVEGMYTSAARAVATQLSSSEQSILDMMHHQGLTEAMSKSTIPFEHLLDLTTTLPAAFDRMVRLPVLGLPEPERSRIKAKIEEISKRIPSLPKEQKVMIYAILGAILTEIDKIVAIPAQSAQGVFYLKLLYSLLFCVAEYQILNSAKKASPLMAEGKPVKKYTFSIGSHKRARKLRAFAYRARKVYGSDRNFVYFIPGFHNDNFGLCQATHAAARRLFKGHPVCKTTSYFFEFGQDERLRCPTLCLYSEERPDEMIVSVPILGKKRMVKALLVWREERDLAVNGS